MKTLEQLTNSVLSRLDDPFAKHFSRALVSDTIQDGYDNLSRDSATLHDFIFVECGAQFGNVVNQDEREFLTPSGLPFYCGQIGYTGGLWEQEFVPNGCVGPVQCTAPWESQYGYVEESLGRIFADLPDDLVEISEVRWDGEPATAESSTTLTGVYARYKMGISGDVYSYTIDGDGLFRLRFVATPSSGSLNAYEGYRGLLRDADDSEFDDASSVGSWGILRSADPHVHAGPPYGHPVMLATEDSNVVIEYFRLGRPLKDVPLELPERFGKYVEFWACSRLLSDEGPGQDLELSKFYEDRYKEGLDRLRKRANEIRQTRSLKMGSGAEPGRGEPGLAQLPWQYGTNISWSPPAF